MRIGLTFNLREEEDEASAELLTQEDVDRLLEAIRSLDHEVIPIEVTAPPRDIIDRLVKAKPELIFNVAEGVGGASREAYYPAIFQMLRIPFTGSYSFALHVGLDKQLTEAILAKQGIRVPAGALIRSDDHSLPEDMPYPLIIKPNAEGSSRGISQESVVENREEAESLIRKLLPEYPQGLTAEEYISGRELAVPWLEAWPGGLLEIVEWKIQREEGHRIMDYESEVEGMLEAVCPPELKPEERQAVLAVADRAVRAMELKDLGRVDIRLDDEGIPYLIEVNALPGLRPIFSYMTGARSKGLEFSEVLGLVIRSAAERFGLAISPKRRVEVPASRERASARELGIRIGRFPSGKHNAITDVAGVRVGHVTHVEDGAPNSGRAGKSTVRTGLTAIVPTPHELFNNHLVAGGFILNGIGEMSGLTQAMEWGWIETPILLTNTMSIGAIHRGIIRFMLSVHPELGHDLSVVIPLIGETDDSFLNDVRVDINNEADALQAIREASDGPVPQGSVGGGTGMISFDFAGGIGSASRVLPREMGGYTIGALVQSNFGKMRNLTVEGDVVGKKLDPLYPYEGRREDDRGSVIVILATDAPLLSTQLTQISKRAALGLGRTGSHASAASGEIVLAFSTANRTARKTKEVTRHLNMSFISDDFISPLYEAAVEITEEAVLNALFLSSGMDGRLGRVAPALPLDTVLDLLGIQIAP
ncbi:MAG: P1 family peptidase [Longimicrobiales bacterium]